MRQPPCFVHHSFPHHVCHFKKLFYDLKQTLWAWFHHRFSTFSLKVLYATRLILLCLSIVINLLYLCFYYMSIICFSLVIISPFSTPSFHSYLLNLQWRILVIFIIFCRFMWCVLLLTFFYLNINMFPTYLESFIFILLNLCVSHVFLEPRCPLLMVSYWTD